MPDISVQTPAFTFDNSYARLPERFFAPQAPTPVASPTLIKLNAPLADLLGLDARFLASPAGVAVLAGNAVPEGAAPLAMAYAGHQFGGFSPQLGDGRAILLGEVIGRDGIRRDIQLKGGGRTPFSRNGDGRAALGPVLREYIVSEAMHALGIPTTRSLAAAATGEFVLREERLPGAVLTRVAQSHVRIGTFEFFRARGDVDGVRTLADYVIARHYPQAAHAEHPHRALLDAVITRTASLVARWMGVGFIHGVINTDNMSIAGETIDYGPCAFMDTYDPATVYSFIDHAGRYAYGNQPRIAYWNLARLAEAMLPLLGEDDEARVAAAREALDTYPQRFEDAYIGVLRLKLGLREAREGDLALARELLDLMAAHKADFTLTFRHLPGAIETDENHARLQFADPMAFDLWATRWRARLAQEADSPAVKMAAMRAANPAFMPRNHRIQAVITAAQDQNDFAPFEELIAVLAAPYEDQPGRDLYAAPPRPEEVIQNTFCGT
jgi:uncharacterized protein YdiU (UPF0061 family)